MGEHSPAATNENDTSSPSREARDCEDTGVGDIGQERVRPLSRKMGAVLASAYQNRGLTHSVTLMPLIDGMLRTAGLSLDDIGLIAAANGPGSFTGLRIGVSAAKGLAWAKELPCCGVSTLACYGADGCGLSRTHHRSHGRPAVSRSITPCSAVRTAASSA